MPNAWAIAALPLAARLELRRQINEETGCWEWQGTVNHKGYGMTSYRGHHTTVHRAAAHAYLGMPLDSPMHVLHRCDNRRCFNPDHLFLGTNLDNVRDRDQKGRRTAPRGEASHSAKLTADDVLAIRAALQAKVPHRKIAAQYGVCRKHVYDIAVGDAWAFLPARGGEGDA